VVVCRPSGGLTGELLTLCIVFSFSRQILFVLFNFPFCLPLIHVDYFSLAAYPVIDEISAVVRDILVGNDEHAFR